MALSWYTPLSYSPSPKCELNLVGCFSLTQQKRGRSGYKKTATSILNTLSISLESLALGKPAVMPGDGLAKRKPAATLGSLWRGHVVSCKGCQRQWKELGNTLPSWVLPWLQPHWELTPPHEPNPEPPPKPFPNPLFTKSGWPQRACCFKSQVWGQFVYCNR